MPAVTQPQLPAPRQALWRELKGSLASLFRRRPRCGRCAKKMTDRFVLGVFDFSPPPDNADFMGRCARCGGAFCFACLGFRFKTSCPRCGSNIVVSPSTRRCGVPVPFDPGCVANLSVEGFRRFGIACCYRLGCDQKDKRLAKALSRLERSLGPPPDEKLRRDAYNAANSAYLALYADGQVIRATACALVCACAGEPNVNLIGNFESALREGEGLSRDEIRTIEREMFLAVKDG